MDNDNPTDRWAQQTAIEFVRAEILKQYPSNTADSMLSNARKAAYGVEAGPQVVDRIRLSDIARENV